MLRRLWIAFAFLLCTAPLFAQTADELIAKNLQAMGGIDKINAIKTLRMSGRTQQDDFTADVGLEWKAPEMIRETFTVQGMSQIQAYDGTSGWQISPFEGRRDPEMLGEEDTRDLVEDAGLFDPLVDYQAKGSTVEYLGMSTIDGDDAYKLKVTLKNGDILYYYLDPDTYMGIRIDREQFIRGALRESVEGLGSYKLVNGVYFPYSIERGSKRNPSAEKVTLDKIEANLELPDSTFKMPSGPAAAAPQMQAETPAKQKTPAKKPAKPPVKP